MGKKTKSLSLKASKTHRYKHRIIRGRDAGRPVMDGRKLRANMSALADTPPEEEADPLAEYGSFLRPFALSLPFPCSSHGL
jgi:hypothetical protein